MTSQRSMGARRCGQIEAERKGRHDDVSGNDDRPRDRMGARRRGQTEVERTTETGSES